MEDTYFVSLDIESTARVIHDAVTNRSFTGKCVDTYTVETSGKKCMVLVYEKYYVRASRVTLTVVIDDFIGKTRVHCVSAGGAEGLIRIDWGASKSFSAIVANNLMSYRI